jgi:hypothetical protein
VRQLPKQTSGSWRCGLRIIRGVKEAAAERGTAVHFGMEQYLKGNKTPEIPDEYMDFWSGMPAILDQFTDVFWLNRLSRTSTNLL